MYPPERFQAMYASLGTSVSVTCQNFRQAKTCSECKSDFQNKNSGVEPLFVSCSKF